MNVEQFAKSLTPEQLQMLEQLRVTSDKIRSNKRQRVDINGSVYRLKSPCAWQVEKCFETGFDFEQKKYSKEASKQLRKAAMILWIHNPIAIVLFGWWFKWRLKFKSYLVYASIVEHCLYNSEYLDFLKGCNLMSAIAASKKIKMLS